MVHKEKVEIDCQRHCPKYRAESKVKGEECLDVAQDCDVMLRRNYVVHFSFLVALDVVKSVKIDDDSHQIGGCDARVGHGEVDKYLPHLGPQPLEAHVGEDYEDGAHE